MNRYHGFRHFLEDAGRNHGNQNAFLFEEQTEKTITWSEFIADVYHRSDELKDSKKTCEGILCDGSLACIEEIFAANLADMQAVLLDHMTPVPLLEQLIVHTDCDCIYGSEKHHRLLDHVLGNGVTDGKGKILFFTSGTTSRAKAVVLTDSSLMNSAYNGGSMLALKEDDILLSCLPLSHVFGFVCGLLWPMTCHALTALGRGPRHYLDDCTYFHPTVISVVPTLLAFFMHHNLLNEELRLILVGAGDCSDDLLQAVTSKNIQVSYGYGLTETSSGVAISTSGNPKAMSVCPDDQIIIAEDGEILIDAPTCMMQGYYEDPESTGQVLVNNLLHTGDLGHLDEEGKLHITGRKKDILVLPNGTKIFLPEYEMEIMKILKNQDLAVILKNHKPVLVLNGLKETKEKTMERLSEVMKKMPRSHQITDIIDLGHELQRTATGKLKRWEIEKEVNNANEK